MGDSLFIPQDPKSCTYKDETQFSTITHGDLAWFGSDVVEPINTVIEQTARLFGDEFVDVATATKGHDACATGKDKWIEGFRSADSKQWTYHHPNALGHQAIAHALEEVIIGGRAPDAGPKPSSSPSPRVAQR